MGVTLQVDEFLLLYIAGCFYGRTDGSFKLKKAIQLVVNKGEGPPCLLLLTYNIFTQRNTPIVDFLFNHWGAFQCFFRNLLCMRKRRLVLLFNKASYFPFRSTSFNRFITSAVTSFVVLLPPISGVKMPSFVTLSTTSSNTAPSSSSPK